MWAYLSTEASQATYRSDPNLKSKNKSFHRKNKLKNIYTIDKKNKIIKIKITTKEKKNIIESQNNIMRKKYNDSDIGED